MLDRLGVWDNKGLIFCVFRNTNTMNDISSQEFSQAVEIDQEKQNKKQSFIRHLSRWSRRRNIHQDRYR